MSNYRLTAAAVMAVLIGGGLIFYEPPKPEPVERPKKVVQENPVHGYGYIDFEQVLLKHSDGEKLKELIGKEIRLKLEFNEIMRPVAPPKLPEIDLTPFEESARKRNMQNLISKAAEIRARKKRIAEEYTEQTAEDYLKRRNEIRDFYMNEAFNITLKLQNAKTLHLKPEQIQELEQRLDALVIERNQRQAELLNERAAEIEAYANSQVAEDMEKLRLETEELKEKYSEEAMQKIRDTQERNKALMRAAMQEMAFRQTRRREILDELTKTLKEREKLEDSILDSISNEAGKLGALYKLQMVFVKRQPSYVEEILPKNLELNFELSSQKPPGAMIFEGNDTKDLTADLLKTVH